MLLKSVVQDYGCAIPITILLLRQPNWIFSFPFDSPFLICIALISVFASLMALLRFFRESSFFASPVTSHNTLKCNCQWDIVRMRMHTAVKKKKEEKKKANWKKHLNAVGIWTHGLCLLSQTLYHGALPTKLEIRIVLFDNCLSDNLSFFCNCPRVWKNRGWSNMPLILLAHGKPPCCMTATFPG